MNVTKRHARGDYKMSSSTGKIASGHTPRRRRRDRVERAVAQSEWEGGGGNGSQMVGPLPGNVPTLREEKMRQKRSNSLFYI